MQKKNLAINCDLGEGAGNDAYLMPFIEACSIACGGHYGDESTIRSTIQLAKSHGVKIGAHPSYPDVANFGRLSMNLSTERLKETILEQVQLFFKVANEENVSVNHIKLHGALYNDVAVKPELALIVADLILEHWPNTPFFSPPNAVLYQLNTGLKLVSEAFIDRTYQSDLSLTPRKLENALIENPETAWKQFRDLTIYKQVKAVNRKYYPLDAYTFCIHGDAPKAIEILTFIQQRAQHEFS